MGGLQNFENRLEQAISGIFARAFRSAVQPVEIAAALQREMDNNAQILSRNRRLVPNIFHVELAQGDMERLAPYDTTMSAEITDQLRDHADQQGYVFPGPVHLAFEPADNLTTGRFRVRSRAQAKVSGMDTETKVGRARALLEVNGTRHALPTGSTTVVGRGSEADIRVNDPGVSRRHAEFSVEQAPGRIGGLGVQVRDLGSTNGMQVDGRRLASSPLEEGTTVRIGSTTMTIRLDLGGEGGAHG